MKKSKNELRKKFRELRDRLPFSYRKGANGKIARNFLAVLKELPQVKRVGVYVKTGSEVNTIPIIEELLKLKKTVAAPNVVPKNILLRFRVLKHGLKDCIFGEYNILEPSSKCPLVPIQKIDLFLVPGIAFDLQGHRIGYGKGFYDRLLKKLPLAITVGLSYHKTFLKKLPHDSRDIPMEFVITEKGVFQAARKNKTDLI